MNRYLVRPDPYLSTPRRAEVAIIRRQLDAPVRLTALFASDFHLRPKADPELIAAQMARCGADLILLGGDYADRRRDALRLFDALRDVRAPLGIFAVAGNNDTEAFSGTSNLGRCMERTGIELLVNRSVAIGPKLRIGGVDEYRHGHPDPAVFPRDGRYRILLSHYPVPPQLDSENMPNLMLSGHTHGGQFNFFGVTPYAIGFERMGKRRCPPALVSGLRRFGPTTLLVSKGIGDSRVPLRVGVRREIERIELGTAPERG